MTSVASLPSVPFLELLPTYTELRADMDEAYRRVMSSGWYLLGKELENFEAAFSRFCGARFCIGVGNGLDALHLALKALDIGPGDEVIVPSNTYIATWLAVSYAGARPVPVEPDPQTFNIDPNRIEQAITPRTKAIMPVHLYGLPADMQAIASIASRHSLEIVDDAAQAHGARCAGRTVGLLGDVTGFSFYPGKNLGAFGDAGAVVTGDPAVAEKLRRLRNYGSAVKYHNEDMGVNSRLDELQAAFLSVKLQRLSQWNDRRSVIASHYLRELQDVPDLVLPSVPDWAEPVWHLFVVRHPQRDKLQQHLASRGIGTLIHYPIPPYRSGAYKSEYGSLKLPIADQLASEVLSLPIGPHLSQEQAWAVTEAIKSFVC